MHYSTNHTIYLQDGSLFSFRRRFKKHSQTLIQAFSRVIDGRSKFGKRHTLALVLVILFSGVTAGNTTVKDCHIWALHNRKWLKRYFELLHGLPDERTLSRAIARIEVNSLIRAFLTWKTLLYGLDCSLTASFDGKTLNGVHGKKRIKHILSLFSHVTHQILGQIGVTQKENEIPAFKRLLREQEQTGVVNKFQLMKQFTSSQVKSFQPNKQPSIPGTTGALRIICIGRKITSF